MRLAGDERRDMHQILSEEGMSTRAAAAITGSSEATVRRDIATASNDAVAAVTITGLNGKQYTRPAPAPVEDAGTNP